MFPVPPITVILSAVLHQSSSSSSSNLLVLLLLCPPTVQSPLQRYVVLIIMCDTCTQPPTHINVLHISCCLKDPVYSQLWHVSDNTLHACTKMWNFGTTVIHIYIYIYIYIYRLKNENIQICNKINVRPSAKHVTSDIGNSVKDI